MWRNLPKVPHSSNVRSNPTFSQRIISPKLSDEHIPVDIPRNKMKKGTFAQCKQDCKEDLLNSSMLYKISKHTLKYSFMVIITTMNKLHLFEVYSFEMFHACLFEIMRFGFMEKIIIIQTDFALHKTKIYFICLMSTQLKN